MVINLIYRRPKDIRSVFTPEDIKHPYQREIPLAHLTDKPEEILKKLIYNYYIVDYLGVKIPSKSVGDNINEGLVILSEPNIVSIEGTLEDLKNNPWFEKARHPFTTNELRKVGENLKEQFDSHLDWKHDQISEEEVQIYLTIFQNMSYNISHKDLNKIIIKHKKLKAYEKELQEKYSKNEKIRNAGYFKHRNDYMGASQ